MKYRLDRSYYSINREIYEWVKANTKSNYDNGGYSVMFGYQEIELTEEEHKQLRLFIEQLREEKKS